MHPVRDAGRAGTVLAFDVGLKRTGVAVGNTLTGTAQALTVIPLPLRNGWKVVDAMIQEWQPTEIIVGLPLELDGRDGPVTPIANRFANRMQARFQIPVHKIDERHTSREAEREFRELRGRGLARKSQAASLDSVAARRILERWLVGPRHDHDTT